MNYDLLIKNGIVVTEQKIIDADVYVKDGIIAKILIRDGSSRLEECTEATTVIDAEGNYVFPGFIDPHVHFNDPGLTNSEDFYTGTCAAAAGGITTVLEHPLTFPLPDNIRDFEEKRRITSGKAVVDFGLFGACSHDNEKEMEKIIGSGAMAFKTFLPYSPEIPRLDDGQILDRMKFLSAYDIVLAIHCENNDIVNYYTDKMVKEGKIKPEHYPMGRPEIAEIEAVARMSLFALKTGCKVNIAHCTLAEAVDIVKNAQKSGANISVETCPQYLTLDDSALKDKGVFAVCNPPLRSEAQVEKLWKRVLNGDIDWICSDHATYTIEEKLAGVNNVFDTPAGVTSVELCYQLLFSEGVIKRGMPLCRFAELSSANAAKRYNLYPQKGAIAEGSDADFAILNSHLKWQIKDDKLKQMIKWSPYEGKSVTGKVTKTILRGKEIYDGEEVTAQKGYGRYLAPLTREK